MKSSSTATARYATSTALARIYCLGLGAISLPLFSRLLGPDGRGEYAVFLNLVWIIAALGNLGVNQVLIKEMPAASDAAARQRLAGAAILSALIATAGAWLILAICQGVDAGPISSLNNEMALLALYICVPFAVWNFHGQALMLGAGRLESWNLQEALSQTIRVAGAALLIVTLGLGAVGAMTAAVLASAWMTLVSLRPIHRFIEGRPSLAFAVAIERIKEGGPVLLTTVGSLLLLKIDVLLLSMWSSVDEIGRFDLAARICGLALLLPQALSFASLGVVANRGAKAAWEDQRRLVIMSMSALVPVIPVAAYFSEDAVRLLGGDGFEAAGGLLVIMLFSLPGMFLNQLMSSQWTGRGLFKETALINLAAGGINAVAICLLAPTLHGVGAALSSVLAQWVVMVPANAWLAFRVCEREYREDGAKRYA